ncbi:MAG: alpha/beta hydrolase [Deltaproteobacteria bacterium]|nr:alpha/beta hydrolase [Deltaproteobacteria bacterium]
MIDLRKVLFDAGRSTLEFGERKAAEVMEYARSATVGSLTWTADRIDDLVQRQITERLVVGLRSSSDAIRRANIASAAGLSEAVRATTDAFRLALNALDEADEYTRRSVLENVHVGSIVGTSFAGVKLSDIRPAFRLDGKDVSALEMASRYADSGLRRVVVCVPGMLSDETLWTNADGPWSLDRVLEDEGVFLARLRINPGVHISENGAALRTLIESFADSAPLQGRKVDVMTYSLGGLVLRSALDQAKSAGASLGSRLGKAVLISSPDGGSYLEKIGFWVGKGLEDTYLPLLHVLGVIGNQRSDAIRDLSHGVIREEEWMRPAKHLARYTAPRYFGELDDVDAFQVYSVLHPGDEPWKAWIGDGIVEKPSLTLLSGVYRAKPEPERRVHEIHGKSHFQVIHAEDTCQALASIFQSGAPSRRA